WCGLMPNRPRVANLPGLRLLAGQTAAGGLSPTTIGMRSGTAGLPLGARKCSFFHLAHVQGPLSSERCAQKAWEGFQHHRYDINSAKVGLASAQKHASWWLANVEAHGHPCVQILCRHVSERA